jgi:aconitate hydratase 2/2-methylisocitrate dehydratase
LHYEKKKHLDDFDFEMIKSINNKKNSIMNIYNDYLQKSKNEKVRDLKPIDGAELLSEIIAQIKDSDNADREGSLKFLLIITVQELLQLV